MHTTHTVSLAVSAFLLLAPGCILQEPNLGDFCRVDFDCVEPRHVCDVATNTCLGPQDIPEPGWCIDQDNDGYGVGDDRTECRFPQEDTDDTDADIYPGADDTCDGKDNDSDGAIDETLECENIADCPRQNLPESAFFRCIANTCVLKPADTTPPGCDVELSCVDGAYEDVPEICK